MIADCILFDLHLIFFTIVFFESSCKGTTKCIKEEVHKDVVVTGEFSITETPGHIVSSSSLILSNRPLGTFKSDRFKGPHSVQ